LLLHLKKNITRLILNLINLYILRKVCIAFESALDFLVSGYISLAIAKAAGADIMLATSK
jgi:hypothetical protein